MIRAGTTHKAIRLPGDQGTRREEIVAPKANCGIALLHRVGLLLQVFPFVRAWVWGRGGPGRGAATSRRAVMRPTGPSGRCAGSAGGRVNQTDLVDEAHEARCA